MSFDPRRRQLLKTLVVAASTLPFASRLGPAFAAGAVPVDEALFPQWLASGDPRPDRVLLWTRVPGAGDVAVRLQVALDAGFERLVVYVCGLGNIRDAIPYPRAPGSAEF